MNHRTRLGTFSAACLFLVCLAGGLESRAQEMQYPVASAVAQDGTIYVADVNAPAIWKIKDGKVEKYFEGSKKFRTPLNRPRCLAIDNDGKLLAGDSAMREVYRFDEAGQPTPLTKGGIGIPRSIVVLPSGELMVSDQELHCIWKVPAAGGDPVKFADVAGIIAMCGDKEGTLWVSSGLQPIVRRVKADGTVEEVVSDALVQFPQELVVDAAKTVYLADNYSKTIWKIAEGQPPTKLAEGTPLVSPVGITWSGEKMIVTDPRAKGVFELDQAGQITKIAPAS